MLHVKKISFLLPSAMKKELRQVIVRDGYGLRGPLSQFFSGLYLTRWARWWVNTSDTWQYHELLTWFIYLCWNTEISAYTTSLLQSFPVKELRTYLNCSPALAAG